MRAASQRAAESARPILHSARPHISSRAVPSGNADSYEVQRFTLTSLMSFNIYWEGAPDESA